MSEIGGSENIIMTEIDKCLLAFLNGLSKRLIFDETGITDEFLRNEVLGGMSEEGGYIIVLRVCITTREVKECCLRDCIIILVVINFSIIQHIGIKLICLLLIYSC